MQRSPERSLCGFKGRRNSRHDLGRAPPCSLRVANREFSGLAVPTVSDAPPIVLTVIKPSSDDYDNLRPFFAYAPARLQERVLALVGSRPMLAGYSWSEETGGHDAHWQGLAVVGNSVLLVDAIAPVYGEDPHELHKLTDARVTMFPGRHVESLEAIEAERAPQFMRQDNMMLACRWTVGFSDGTSLTFPEERRSGRQDGERAELLASALADLLGR